MMGIRGAREYPLRWVGVPACDNFPISGHPRAEERMRGNPGFKGCASNLRRVPPFPGAFPADFGQHPVKIGLRLPPPLTPFILAFTPGVAGPLSPLTRTARKFRLSVKPLPSTMHARRIRLAAVAAIGLGCLARPSSSVAQEVIAAPPAISTTPPAMQTPQNAPTEATNPWGAPPSLLEANPLTFGPVSLHPHFLYRYLDGTGIRSSPGHSRNTVINMISPGVLFMLGNQWTLDYTLTRTLYSNPAFRDTTDHFVALQGGTSYQAWTFGFKQTYTMTSAPLVETGGQTKRETVGTNLDAHYRITDRTTLELSAAQDLRYARAFQNSYVWSTTDWLHHQFVPGLDTALGLGLGYVDLTSSPNLNFYNYLGQVGWSVAQRVNLSVQGGVEVLKSQAAGASDITDPTLMATLQYQPSETTTLLVTAGQRLSTSYFNNQVVKAATWDVGLRQRLLGHIYLSSDYRGGKSSYLSVDPTVSAGREDRIRSFDIRLSIALLQRGTLAVLYNWSHNSSNAFGYGFSTHQFGVELGYKF